MEATQQAKETTAVDLGALLDACDDAVVTLVAGETRLVAHRAVLIDRSAVIATMFPHDLLEASSRQVTIADVEGPVLRQLLAFLYTLGAPHLPDMVAQLLVAADKYGVAGLKAACEQQVTAQLSVETAASAAVLAIRHSCESLTQDAVNFIKANPQVMATPGWADAFHKHPKEVFEVTRLLADPPAESRINTMEAIMQAKETTAVDLGALLDDGDDAVVTLVAGKTRLVAHRVVIVDRSPVFAAMFAHDMLEASSGLVTIADVEGPVLRQLLAFLYTLRAPQLLDMAAQLLVAADKYGVSALKAACEQQVAAQLSVETAAAAAVLAVRHSCESLRKAAVAFIKANFLYVVGTQGWADAVINQSKDVVEVSRLLADPPAGSRSLAAVSRLRSLPADERHGRLLQAAVEGAVWELEALLVAGVDVTASYFSGHTALLYAAEFGHVEAARWLLARGAPVDAGNRQGDTPLHKAAHWGHAAVVWLLLDASADHSARGYNGWTPLHYAAFSGHREAAAALLEKGADREARGSDGLTPLDLARRHNHKQLVELLTRT